MSTRGELSGAPGPRRFRPGTDLDFFIDPAWATEALLTREDFFGTVLDPACGTGTIVKALRAAGIKARGSDIVDRGFGTVRDFLTGRAPRADSIVCNPPYGLAVEFTRRALTVASRRVAMLVQSKFPYSQARHDFFTREARPSAIYFLSDRPSMPPGAEFLAGIIKRGGGKLDYMWIVWDVGVANPSATVCDWLRRGG